MNFAESFSSSDLADIGGPSSSLQKKCGDWLSCASGFCTFLFRSFDFETRCATM